MSEPRIVSEPTFANVPPKTLMKGVLYIRAYRHGADPAGNVALQIPAPCEAVPCKPIDRTWRPFSASPTPEPASMTPRSPLMVTTPRFTPVASIRPTSANPSPAAFFTTVKSDARSLKSRVGEMEHRQLPTGATAEKGQIRGVEGAEAPSARS